MGGEQARLVDRTAPDGTVTLVVEGTEPPAWAFTLEAYAALKNAALTALSFLDSDDAEKEAKRAAAEENAKAPPPVPVEPTPLDPAKAATESEPAVGTDGIPEQLRAPPPPPKGPRELAPTKVTTAPLSVQINKAEALTPPSTPIQLPKLLDTPQGPVITDDEPKAPASSAIELPREPAQDASLPEKFAHSMAVKATLDLHQRIDLPVAERMARVHDSFGELERIREANAPDRDALAKTIALTGAGLTTAALFPPAAPVVLGATVGALRAVAEQNVIEKVPLDQLDSNRAAEAGVLGGAFGGVFQAGAQVLPRLTNAAGVALSGAAAIHGAGEILEGAAQRDPAQQLLGSSDMLGAGAGLLGTPQAAKDARAALTWLVNRFPVIPGGTGGPPAALVTGSGGLATAASQSGVVQVGGAGGGPPNESWLGGVLATTGAGGDRGKPSRDDVADADESATPHSTDETPTKGTEAQPENQTSAAGAEQRPARTLAEWLVNEPLLLERARVAFRDAPEWNGIDPDSTLVRFVPESEVLEIRRLPGESGGHHPHGLALGGPPGQTLTPTGESRTVKNPNHVKATNLQRAIIRAIKQKQAASREADE